MMLYFFLSLSNVFTPSQAESLKRNKDTTSPEDLVKESNEFVLSFRWFELEDPEMSGWARRCWSWNYNRV